MNRLILVKHAAPEILPERPAKDWGLSSAGRRQSEALVARFESYDAGAVVTSEELKAVTTAEILAEGLKVPFSAHPGLHENDRTGFPFFRDEAELQERIRRFFDRPTERIIGEETADEAHTRFAEAVREVRATDSESSVIAVSHGTVISLLVSRANGLDPFPFWKQLEFTSFVVLDAESFALDRVAHPRGGAD